MDPSSHRKQRRPTILPNLLQLLLLLALPLFALHRHRFHCPSSSPPSPPLLICRWIDHYHHTKPSFLVRTTTAIVACSWSALLCFAVLRLLSAYRDYRGGGIAGDSATTACGRRRRRAVEREENARTLALVSGAEDILRRVEEVSKERIRTGMYRDRADGGSVAAKEGEEKDGGGGVTDDGATDSKTAVVANVEREAAKEEEDTRSTDAAITCLDALALRFHGHSSTSTSTSSSDGNRLPRICIEASHIVLRSHPNDDEAVAACFSLLALVASSPSAAAAVPNAATEDEGLGLAIASMRNALRRTRRTDYRRAQTDAAEEEEDAEERERICAELQRKACLYLGALAETDRTPRTTAGGAGSVSGRAASAVVDGGGTEAILDSLAWFRRHVPVVNWALWALFNVCYGHGPNKREFVRANGVGRVCTVLACVLDDFSRSDDDGGEDGDGGGDEEDRAAARQAVRHGIAVLFDVLRYDEADYVDRSVESAMQLRSDQRKIALTAGLGDVVRTAVGTFPESTEIVMMGQQMLVTVVGVNNMKGGSSGGGGGGAIVPSKKKNGRRQNPRVRA